MDIKEAAVVLFGKKFYKQIKGSDDYKIVRVTKIIEEKDNDTIIEYTKENGSSFNITAEKFLSKYTGLKPDGLTVFIKGTMSTPTDKYSDVLVSYLKESTLESETSNTADVICRQFMIDLNKKDNTEKDPWVGCTVSKHNIKDTQDQEIYNSILSLDRIDLAVSVHTYITDTVDDLLQLLGSQVVKLFDDTLEKAFQKYLTSIAGLDMKQKSLKGHCRTLSTLLHENNFQYFIDNTNGVFNLDLDIQEYLEIDEDGMYTIMPKLNNLLNNLYLKRITNTKVLKYDHDIDLSRITCNYILLRDSNNDIYIIRYIEDGELFEHDVDKALIEQASKLIPFNLK